MAELRVFLADGDYRVPPAAEDIWDASLAMEAGRQGNGYGYLPFPWEAIAAFCALSGFRPRRWQLKALRAMEIEWLNHKNDTAPADAPKEGRQFSLDLFDAWF